MLTSKQRAQLRGLAASETPIIYVGKEGITETVIASARDALAARELVKGQVQENSMFTAREACDAPNRCRSSDGNSYSISAMRKTLRSNWSKQRKKPETLDKGMMK